MYVFQLLAFSINLKHIHNRVKINRFLLQQSSRKSFYAKIKQKNYNKQKIHNQLKAYLIFGTCDTRYCSITHQQTSYRKYIKECAECHPFERTQIEINLQKNFIFEISIKPCNIYVKKIDLFH